MATAIRGMPGSEFEPRRPLQKTPPYRVVFFSCAPQRSPSCQPAAGGYRSRQPGHFLESASLHPPQAALRRFPRRPLQKEYPIRQDGVFFLECAAAPENSLPRPARSASNQEVRQGSCEWRQPFVGCREASSSLVARSKKHHPIGWCFFRVRLSAHRRVSRLPAATAADSRDTSSKAPRFIRRRRRFGAFLVARSKKERHPCGVSFFFGAALLLRKSGRLRAGD